MADEKTVLVFQQKVFLSKDGRDALHQLAAEREVSMSRVVEDLLTEAKEGAGSIPAR